MSEVFEKKVREDVSVKGRIGFGVGTVTLEMSPGDMTWMCDMDPEAARDLGVALMDAANELDRRLTKKCEPAT